MFPVAAIGASAGGLKAFEGLLNALPPEPGMAFVLVPHLAPQYKSHLTEILARSTKLRVSEVRNGDKVSPDRIYILPPNRSMLIKGGVLRLSSSARGIERRNPIDAFFRSMAEDLGERAIGVLLSGEGSDGTDGLRAIKECGGTTFAQDGESAAHLSMPHSAVVSGCVDLILSPAEIGKRLCLAREAGDGYEKDRGIGEHRRGDGALDGILGLLRAARGVEFDLYKRSTLRRRIRRRMALMRIDDPADYLHMLETDAVEVGRLYRDLLICVTSFFREPGSFRALKKTIYPRILKGKSSREAVRIWVPGCSTGEEAYSHAMNLVEFLGRRGGRRPSRSSRRMSTPRSSPRRAPDSTPRRSEGRSPPIGSGGSSSRRRTAIASLPSSASGASSPRTIWCAIPLSRTSTWSAAEICSSTWVRRSRIRPCGSSNTPSSPGGSSCSAVRRASGIMAGASRF